MRHTLTFVLAVITVFIIMSANGRPSNDFSIRNSVCRNNEEKRDMCMYCAKQTKSPYTYPNCCTNQDNVHIFCEAFTKFGLRIY